MATMARLCGGTFVDGARRGDWMIMHLQNGRETLESTTNARRVCFARIGTPIGKLLLVGERDGTRLALRGIYFDGAPHAAGAVPHGACEDEGAFAEVRAQL